MRKITFQLVFRVLILVFIVYAAMNLISLRGKIRDRREEYASLQQQILEQKLENKRMEETIGEELSDEEIASIARERLGYSLPGERVFIDITGK